MQERKTIYFNLQEFQRFSNKKGPVAAVNLVRKKLGNVPCWIASSDWITSSENRGKLAMAYSADFYLEYRLKKGIFCSHFAVHCHAKTSVKVAKKFLACLFDPCMFLNAKEREGADLSTVQLVFNDKNGHFSGWGKRDKNVVFLSRPKKWRQQHVKWSSTIKAG